MLHLYPAKNQQHDKQLLPKNPSFRSISIAQQ